MCKILAYLILCVFFQVFYLIVYIISCLVSLKYILYYIFSLLLFSYASVQCIICVISE